MRRALATGVGLILVALMTTALTQPVGAEPAGAQPVGAEPAGAQPVGAEPASAQSVGAKPAEAEPAVAQRVRADTTTEFDPGFIISDDSFYNDHAMTADQIQQFLESKNCTPKDGVPCLADYRETTTTQPTQFDHCTRYEGARKERASTIIAKIAHACTISPHVLLVLLQKEQSLVTAPSAYGYQRATGYSCPDTAACDTKYFGFFNQVYNAAWQFREYSASDDWRYHIGKVEVQYSPNATCGSSVIDIRNQATANLYNYTPYQPSNDTVAQPNAAPTPCSTYGNLNFSRIYTKWFGDPTALRLPPWWAGCLVFAGGNTCPTDPSAVSIP